MNRVWIVLDLGFGDAGKGGLVDALVRRTGARLVVRWNGGAQAGHTVVLEDGRWHTFAQFGAGSFVPGTRTLLGPEFVLHPGGMRVEAHRLASMGVADAVDRTAVHREALVVSPFQQAAGRLREMARGAGAHGTCGVGVGEARMDALDGRADVLRAGDLADSPEVRRRLAAQQERKRADLAIARGCADERAAAEWGLLDDPDAVDRVLALWEGFAREVRVVDRGESHAILQSAANEAGLVFEGAQGVLLDQDHGFHPHTTWSDCTPRGARALLDGVDAHPYVLGVTRAYAVRHGPGPFPTADSSFARDRPESHQDEGGWQGPFRAGPLDLVLLRYAVGVAGRIDGLAVTCLDRVSDPIPVCTEYDDVDAPRISELPRNDLFRALEFALGAAVVLERYGPTAASTRIRG